MKIKITRKIIQIVHEITDSKSFQNISNDENIKRLTDCITSPDKKNVYPHSLEEFAYDFMDRLDVIENMLCSGTLNKNVTLYSKIIDAMKFEYKIHLNVYLDYVDDNDSKNTIRMIMLGKENYDLKQFLHRWLTEPGYRWPSDKRATRLISVDMSFDMLVQVITLILKLKNQVDAIDNINANINTALKTYRNNYLSNYQISNLLPYKAYIHLLLETKCSSAICLLTKTDLVVHLSTAYRASSKDTTELESTLRSVYDVEKIILNSMSEVVFNNAIKEALTHLEKYQPNIDSKAIFARICIESKAVTIVKLNNNTVLNKDIEMGIDTALINKPTDSYIEKTSIVGHKRRCTAINGSEHVNNKKQKLDNYENIQEISLEHAALNDAADSITPPFTNNDAIKQSEGNAANFIILYYIYYSQLPLQVRNDSIYFFLKQLIAEEYTAANKAWRDNHLNTIIGPDSDASDLHAKFLKELLKFAIKHKLFYIAFDLINEKTVSDLTRNQFTELLSYIFEHDSQKYIFMKFAHVQIGEENIFIWFFKNYCKDILKYCTILLSKESSLLSIIAAQILNYRNAIPLLFKLTKFIENKLPILQELLRVPRHDCPSFYAYVANRNNMKAFYNSIRRQSEPEQRINYNNMLTSLIFQTRDENLIETLTSLSNSGKTNFVIDYLSHSSDFARDFELVVSSQAGQYHFTTKCKISKKSKLKTTNRKKETINMIYRYGDIVSVLKDYECFISKFMMILYSTFEREVKEHCCLSMLTKRDATGYNDMSIIIEKLNNKEIENPEVIALLKTILIIYTNSKQLSNDHKINIDESQSVKSTLVTSTDKQVIVCAEMDDNFEALNAELFPHFQYDLDLYPSIDFSNTGFGNNIQITSSETRLLMELDPLADADSTTAPSTPGFLATATHFNLFKKSYNSHVIGEDPQHISNLKKDR